MSETAFLVELQKVIRQRLADAPEGSYTARLASQGMLKVAQKLGEEGVELALAAAAQDQARVTAEAADLVYHLLLLLAMRYLPRTRAGGWLVLQKAVPTGASIPIEPVPAGSSIPGPAANYIGLRGEAATDLRPSGKGRFEGLWLDIIADGEYIEKGTPLQVVRHEGARIVVARREG